MTKEQQYWEDTQEALSRIFDRCEEIDPQSGYDMLEDIQFVRGFINKHAPQEKPERVESTQKHVENTLEMRCEDAISRQAALKLFATHDGKHLFEAIRDLPTVTPTVTEFADKCRECGKILEEKLCRRSK